VSSAVKPVVATDSRSGCARICRTGKGEVTYSPEAEGARHDREGLGGISFFKGAGCDVCADSGYRRAGLYEVMPLSPEAAPYDIEGRLDGRAAGAGRQPRGCSRCAGRIVKIRKGVTTLEEVVKETQDDGPQAAPAAAPSGGVNLRSCRGDDRVRAAICTSPRATAEDPRRRDIVNSKIETCSPEGHAPDRLFGPHGAAETRSDGGRARLASASRTWRASAATLQAARLRVDVVRQIPSA